MVLPLVYCPADDTLFEVGPEICYSDCEVVAVVMETTQLVLSQLKKTFYRSQWRIE